MIPLIAAAILLLCVLNVGAIAIFFLWAMFQR